MIGPMLKKLRRECDMTQADVAKKLNVSQQAVQKWESGTNEPDFKTAFKIASMFGVTVEALAGIPVTFHADLVRNVMQKSGDYNPSRTVEILRRLKAEIDTAIDDAIREALDCDDEITPEERRIYEKVRRHDARRIEKDSTTSDAG